MKSENKAGLYITIIVHLVVVIFLLCLKIGSVLKAGSSFELDFTAQDKAEKQQAAEKFEKDISDLIDDMLAGRVSVEDLYKTDPHAVRNMTVDANLKDAKGTDAESLYDEAKRLEEALKRGNQADEDGAGVSTDPVSNQKQETEKPYSGPSVVSYNLDGRKASHLSIPAYKCFGGGDVAVAITVDSGGKVIEAKVIESMSSKDDCLRDFAIRAAKASQFSKSTTVARQSGDILYRFIAQ
ncbi:MAG: energy transducer TonB [Bacteroidales bacterium]|nr:energy transducer TonB [Bacteroidales bacterium]